MEQEQPKKPKIRSKRAKWEPEGERARRVAAQGKHVPISARESYFKACRGGVGAKTAIKAFCLQCTGYDRDSVRHCTALICPLWAYRPFQNEVSGTRVRKNKNVRDTKELSDIPDIESNMSSAKSNSNSSSNLGSKETKEVDTLDEIPDVK